MFEFDWPWVFWFLPLPVLVYFFAPAAKREEVALKVPYFQQITQLYKTEQGKIVGSKKLKLALLSFIWLLLVGSAARPQWLGEAITLPTSGRDLLLAVDISGSMETADMVVEGQQIPRVLATGVCRGKNRHWRRHRPRY